MNIFKKYLEKIIEIIIKNSKELDIDNNFQVAAFYSFSPVNEGEIPDLIEELTIVAKQYDVRGMILIALEGINGTICGPINGVTAIKHRLASMKLENPFEIKYSNTSKHAFRRFKARRKNEIVTMGVANVDPLETVGEYIEPTEWNDFVEDPSTLVIDTRNNYEVAIGSFKGAINPDTDTFRDFPAWVEHNLSSILKGGKYKRIASFCTGGIRCEKSTSFLKAQGFLDVHHLHGGILRYLAEVPEEQSCWEGECFVFDHRVSLDHNLKPGTHKLCFACGIPLSVDDRNSPSYIPGIQCHHCEDVFSDYDRERFKERQKHIKELQERLPGNSIWPSA